MRFKIPGKVTTAAYVEVDADNWEDAVEKARKGGWGSGIGVNVETVNLGSYCVNDDIDEEQVARLNEPQTYILTGGLVYSGQVAVSAHSPEESITRAESGHFEVVHTTGHAFAFEYDKDVPPQLKK